MRLTGWYLSTLVIGLGIFGIGSWFAIRASAFHAVDDELIDRVRGVEKFMQLQIASLSPVEIRDEFREHSVLGPGGDLFQVCDERGTWLYRSAVLENSQISIRLPSQLSSEPVFEDLTVQGTPVRFATRRVIVNDHPYSVQVATPMSEFFEALHRFGVILWLLVPILVAGAGVGGFWISRRALRPVDQITAAAESISITNLAHRLTVPATGDELQRLSETMNRMLSRLNSSVQRMSQFTADASHELRAPIAVILTTAELAAKDGRTATELRDDMAQIRGEAERTRRLIESLLLLARADAGEDGFQMEPSDVTSCVRQAIRQAESVAHERKAVIELVAPEQPIVVSGDADALRRLVFNLIDNGVKYGAAGGKVRVALAQEDGLAVCSVTDSGIGIAAEHIEHIFDRFWRADKVRSRGEGGAGIGLSIAHWIIDRHQGTIEVKSSIGVGTTFTVKLPIIRVSGEVA
jgi:heavy metal sensor kinase